ncbi:MAG TPA: hypothetical protein VHX68_16235 [Planctomycetaceae bacterium]|nr:hypothetical protein [Planctomycetaceae bacterium]
MIPTVVGYHPRTPLVRSAVGRTARLSIFGLIAWFWFLAGNNAPRKTVGLVAVLVLAALVGLTWYASRARADRRRRAAFDRYARLEQAKVSQSRQNPRSHLHPQAG